MSKITIVARILAKPEEREFVKSELLKLVEPTRAEKGCINYDLHIDNNNENLFMFHENWESEDFLTAHTKSTHFAEYNKATDGKIEEFTVNKLTHIS